MLLMQHRACLRGLLSVLPVVHTHSCVSYSTGMQGIDNMCQAPDACWVKLAMAHVLLCSLQKPAVTFNLTGIAKRMPKIWSKNKQGAKALCVDNLSCIWTSDRDLRLAIKPVVDYTEVSRLW